MTLEMWDNRTSSALVLETCILVRMFTRWYRRSHLWPATERTKSLNWVLHCWFFCMYGKLLYPQSHAKNKMCHEEIDMQNFHSYWFFKETRGSQNFPRSLSCVAPKCPARRLSWNLVWNPNLSLDLLMTVSIQETAYGFTIKTFDLNLFCCV